MYQQQFHTRLQHLNEAQRKAVETIEGPVLVVAGPGTGKTELLSMRVANILHETDALPESILCLTFTEAAARNMRERLSGLIGPAAYRVAMNTFHGFGKDIRNEFRGELQVGTAQDVVDEVEQLKLLSELLSRLPLKHPLHKKNPDGNWTYLKDLKDYISRLKQGGLRPEEYQHILQANHVFMTEAAPLLAEFMGKRVSKKVFEELPALCHELQMITIPAVEHFGFSTLQNIVVGELAALEDSKMLSTWKKLYMVKDEENQSVHKAYKNHEKLEGAATIYQQYQEEMRARGWFDFDDMLLDTVYGMEQHADIRYTLQERFQYILVDEFQDTNGVQMRLLRALFNLEVTDGNPNVMAVGDDDQAIYKFQGATLSNLLTFRQQFTQPEFITLTQNYRSHQNILDLAQRLMEQAEDRLGKNEEGYVPKQLQASHPERAGLGSISYDQFQTPLHEMEALVQQITTYHTQGIAYEEMAVIAPKHKYLVAIAEYLHTRQIPISYTKKNNVLDDELIQQLYTMLQFIASLGLREAAVMDELLPKMLSFSFWGISTEELWKFAVQQRTQWGTWWDGMDTHPQLRLIKKFLAELGRMQETLSVEKILDYLLGAQSLEIDEQDYRIPLYDAYFSAAERERNPESYLERLSRIHTFLGALREAQKEHMLTVRDALTLLEIRTNNDIAITDVGVFQSGTDAVALLTGHAAKGLEFEVVFVTAATQDAWVGKGKSSSIGFPPNLPLSPDKATVNDQLRLFYVALTRAKKYLHISTTRYDTAQKEQSAIQFLALAEENPTLHEATTEEHTALLEHKLGIEKLSLPEPMTMEALLRPILDTYMMSVTHLNDYVDIVYKGPRYFLEQHLLRFPRSKNSKGSFGTAMHAAIQEFHGVLRREGRTPDVQVLYDAFTTALRREHIPRDDFEKYHAQGLEDLEVYYRERAHLLRPDDLLERNFREQGVNINGVALTGKIDKMTIHTQEKLIEVTDFKTGNTEKLQKSGKDDATERKLWAYKNQLVFYKLLVEHSKTYMGYKVDRGTLEFLEATKKGEILIKEFVITEQDVEDLRLLLMGVHGRIQRMDFAREADADAKFKDILAFAEELREEARAQHGL